MATLSSKVTPSGVATAAQGTLADSAIQPNDSPSFDGLAVDTDALFVDAATNQVGINTSSPDQALHVQEPGSGSSGTIKMGADYHGYVQQYNNNLNIISNGDQAYRAALGTNNGTGNIVFQTASATTGNTERLRIDASGNVGIGISGPAGHLDIINQVQRYIFRSGRIDCVNSANSAWGTFAVQGNQVDLRTSNGTTRLQMHSNGRVELPNSAGSRGNSGYPITTPNDTVANAIRANGYIEWQTDIGAIGTSYFVSDERKKDNIAPATKQSSDVIEAIQFIEFDWKPDSGGEGHVEVGVSAQQLQTIDPRLVSTLSDDMLMVNEPALVSHLAKALQEALTKIEAMEARLVALESV